MEQLGNNDKKSDILVVAERPFEREHIESQLVAWVHPLMSSTCDGGFWSRADEWWNDNVQPLRYALSKRNVFLKMQRYSSHPKRAWRYVHADNGCTLIMFEGLAMSVCVSVTRPICSIESMKTDTPVQWHPLYSWTFTSKHHCSVPLPPMQEQIWDNGWEVNRMACTGGFVCQSQHFGVFMWHLNLSLHFYIM